MKDDKGILGGLNPETIEQVGASIANGFAADADQAAAGGVMRAKLEVRPEKVKKPCLFESVVTAREMQIGVIIRVWRRWNELPVFVDMEALNLMGTIPYGTQMEDVVKVLSQLDNIVKIEMTDKDGMGAVVCF